MNRRRHPAARNGTAEKKSTGQNPDIAEPTAIADPRDLWAGCRGPIIRIRPGAGASSPARNMRSSVPRRAGRDAWNRTTRGKGRARKGKKKMGNTKRLGQQPKPKKAGGQTPPPAQ